MNRITLKVNGRQHTVTVEPETPLLFVLTDELELRGPRFGCGMAQCGACSVMLDGQVTRSCVTAVSTVGKAEITTLEGLGTPEKPHPIQQAFITEQAMHCGYCLSGPMLYGKAFIDANPNATEDQILQALGTSQLLCRCHSHSRMVKALLRYVEETA